MTRFFPWKKLGSIAFFSLTRITYLVHEAVVFGATIGAAIMVGVLGLPPTVITWCGPGEPITYRKKKHFIGLSLQLQEEIHTMDSDILQAYWQIPL